MSLNVEIELLIYIYIYCPHLITIRGTTNKASCNRTCENKYERERILQNSSK